MEVPEVSGSSTTGDTLRRYCSTEGTTPLLLFPEEDTTNGRRGLLKFRSESTVEILSQSKKYSVIVLTVRVFNSFPK